MSDALPPLNWLRVFEASARHLSFTGAATELHMTQSAVSQQIKALEAHLGRALFHRRPRALALTETGTSYLPIVRDAFRTLSHGTRAVRGGGPGVVRLHANMAFSTFWLAPRLGDFLQRHPDIRLDIQADQWEPQGPIIGADIEIRYSMQPATDRGAIRLAQDRYYPVASPDWQGNAGDIPSSTLFDVSNLLSTWQTWAEDQGLDYSGLPVHLATTYAVTLNAAMAGAGLAMAHDTLAARLIAEGRLKRVGAHRAEMREAYYLIVSPAAAHIPAVRAFADWIRDTRASEPEA
jgi:LysR family glycine cleavage system transcriptional activator